MTTQEKINVVINIRNPEVDLAFSQKKGMELKLAGKFVDKKKAKETFGLNGKTLQIAEYPLDKSYTPFSVQLNEDGTISHTEEGFPEVFLPYVERIKNTIQMILERRVLRS